MAFGKLLSDRIKKKKGSELDSDRYNYIALDNVEPDFGNPSTANGLMSSRQDGTRRFINASGGLRIDSSSNTLEILDVIEPGAGEFGDSSNIPVITINSKGQITSISNTPVGGISSISYDQNNGTISITTSSGTQLDAVISLDPFTTDTLNEGSTNLYYTNERVRSAISADGDLSYDSESGIFSLNVEQVYTKANFDSDLGDALDGGTGITYDSSTDTISITNTGVAAGTYGSASQVPVLKINAQGQVDSAGVITVAGVSSTLFDSATGVYTINTADGNVFNTPIFSRELTRGSLVQGLGVNYDSTSGVISLSQDLSTLSNVTFKSVTTDSLSVDYINMNVNDSAPTYKEGALWYDKDYNTLNYFGDDSNVIHNLGLEEHQRVFNNTGSTILKGAPLYFSGNYNAGTFKVPTIGLANATDANAYNAQGIAAGPIPNNSYGYCLTAGQLFNVNTAHLNANTNFFVGLGPGLTQNASPLYPNFPMCLGWVVVSDATNGVLLVNQQNHSVTSFRVRTSAHIGEDLQVDGNLTILGTQTTVGQSNVTQGAPFFRLNEGDAIGEAGTVFVGTGLDDAFFAGHFTGPSPQTYYVRIDGVGTGPAGVDTFEVALGNDSNFASPILTKTAITGNAQLIHSTDNISVEFSSKTGHDSSDRWAGTASPINVDTGFFTNRNTGTSGVGYTHMGFYFDVSDEKWKVLDEYDSTPTGLINVTDSALGVMVATRFEGSLLGNVTGDLTGDVTGQVSTLSNFTTDDLNEGSTNKYYLKTRVDSDIAASLEDSGNVVNITINETIGSTVDSAYVLARVLQAPFLDSADLINGTLTGLSVADGTFNGEIDARNGITNGQGSLKLQSDNGKNIELRNHSNDIIIRARNSGVAELRYSGFEKLATTKYGVTVTGSVNADSATFTNISGALTGDVTGTASNATQLNNENPSYYLAYENFTGIPFVFDSNQTVEIVDSNLSFNGFNLRDAVRGTFGTDSDLAIYHDNANAYIDNDKGHLYIRNNVDNDDGGNIYLQAKAGEAGITIQDDGTVQLYYNNSLRLATLDNGIDIAGTLNSHTIPGGAGTFALTSDLNFIDSAMALQFLSTLDSSNVSTIVSETVDQTFVNNLNVDADTLDGVNSTSFLRSDVADTKTSGNLNFDDNVKATFGTDSDLEVYHSFGQGYIVNNSSHLFITNTADDFDVRIGTDDGSGSTTNYIIASGSTGEVQLNHYGAQRLNTDSTGVTVTGLTSTGDVTFDSAGAILFDNSDKALEVNSSNYSINLVNNAKIKLGNNSDFTIHHDGTNSIIRDENGHNTWLQTDGDILLSKKNGAGYYLIAYANLGVELRYANSKKFETTKYGATVTGSVNADSATIGNINMTGDLTLTSTDAGAANDPDITLYRNSSSPAASDVLGTVQFKGNNSAGNQETYGLLAATITDPTSGSEDGNFLFQCLKDGTLTTVFNLKGNANTTFVNNDVLLDGVNLKFEGSSQDANETTLTVVNPTAPRTITLPDASGTVLLNESGILNLTNSGSQSEVRLYCESSNAHYAALKAPAHSAFSDNVNLTLPATTGTLALTSQIFDSADVLTVAGTGSLTGVSGAFTASGTGIFDGNGSTNGTTIKSGAIQIRSDSAEAYVDFFCEVSNAHRTRVKSAAHSAYSGQVDVVLPTSSGTLALTSDIPSVSSFITASSTNTLTNKTFDANGTGNSLSNVEVADFAAAAITTEAEGISSNDNDTTLPTSAAVKDYVDNNSPAGGITVQEEGTPLSTSGTTLNFVGSNVTASGTGTTKTITIAGGGSITVQDEGSALTTSGDTLNFVGAGVVASGTGTTKTITISGGGGGSAADSIIRSFIFG